VLLPQPSESKHQPVPAPESPVPLNPEEHRQLALELQSTHARMRSLSDMFAGIYGPQNQAAFTFARVAEALDRLCRDVQVQAKLDCPGVDVDKLYR
jgi:hypothetical protein